MGDRPNAGPERICDLSDGDSVSLTCPRCENVLTLSGRKMQELGRSHTALDAFASRHTCEICYRLGALLSVELQDPEA